MKGSIFYDLFRITFENSELGRMKRLFPTGQEAKYTKDKGFDDNYYKDLIMKYLDQHGKKGRAKINELLLNKLPDALTDKQKIIKVGNLLLALHKAGKIELCEKKLWRSKSSHKS